MTFARVSLMLRCSSRLRPLALGMVGTGFGGAPIFWLMSFVLGLRHLVSVRFLVRFRVRFRTAHLVGRSLLMRHGVILDMALMRDMLLVRARGYDFPAVKFSGARGGGD